MYVACTYAIELPCRDNNPDQLHELRSRSSKQNSFAKGISASHRRSTRKVKLRRSSIWSCFRSPWEISTSLSYSGILSPNQDVLFPAHEGNLQTGHAIDRFGDPDLMAEFSVEYLKQYWAIVPKGRLPHTISEMMPALNLLVNAAELALKANLIRAAKRSEGHSSTYAL